MDEHDPVRVRLCHTATKYDNEGFDRRTICEPSVTLADFRALLAGEQIDCPVCYDDLDGSLL
ncbi:hypothetical protein [uncultured Friedmanniella sp.]|uniref:hypothetical protein n=1 Tax=uncultured Friedmanniella sp. TaxID=335381 RepID=UPI0035C9BBDE